MHQRLSILLPAIFAAAFGAATGESVEPAQPAPAPATTSIRVPRGDGTPVITDGLFSPGEWDDAVRIALGESVALHVKEFRGVVFIGVRGADTGAIGPSELFLATPEGPVHRLHVSAQLGEAVLPLPVPAPSPRFGLTTDWYANELRRDMEVARRLEKEGKTPIEIIQGSSYPCDGIEFAIRRSRFPGTRWLARLSASALLGGKPGMIVVPQGTAETATEGWLELRFE